MWVFGQALIVLDAIMDVISFGLAPQTVLAPLGAMTLVFNTLVSPVMLKEKLAKKDWIATVVIITGILLVQYNLATPTLSVAVSAGTTLAVAFAHHDTPDYTVPNLRSAWARPEVLFARISQLLSPFPDFCHLSGPLL